jgi:hypothetical protein
VVLTVGLRQATVDGRAVMLDVPASIIGGRTMVPLRFVSEAMGARVDWNNASRTVAITSGSGQAGPPAQRPQPAPAPVAPPAGAATIEGTVLRIDAQGAPPRILVERDGRINTFTVTSETTIALVEVGSGRSTTIALDQILVGAHARVTAEAGRAILIRVSIREVSGRVDAVTARQIALSNGQTYTFADDVHVQVNGRDAGREQIRAGMDATLRLHPQSSAVLEVFVRTAAAQPAPPAQPAPSPTAAAPAAGLRIASFAHDGQKPLRAGETLTATLQGNAGGTATFEIFGVATGIAMRETAPGTYQGSYAVKAGDAATNAAVFGRLRVGAQDAPLVQAGTPVTIDTAAPVIAQRYPEAGSTIANARPNILITYNDSGGSGINTAATRLIVNGRDVTAASTVTDTGAAYNPPAALTNRVAVRLVLTDRAGNTTDDRFTFRIAVQQGSLIRSVTVNPTTPLRPGQVLTVSMVGEPGGQAAFSIEDVIESVAMTESPSQPGTYTGTFAVRPSDSARNARISVQLTRGGATSRADASARLTVVADVVVAPTISAPAAGATVRAPIVIRGRATAGHSVVVRVNYRGTVALFQVQGTLGQVTTQADAQGNWSVTLNQDAPVRGADLTISATAVDQANRQSQPTTVTVKQGG